MPDKKPKKDGKKKPAAKKPAPKAETPKVAEKLAEGKAPARPKKKK